MVFYGYQSYDVALRLVLEFLCMLTKGWTVKYSPECDNAPLKDELLLSKRENKPQRIFTNGNSIRSHAQSSALQMKDVFKNKVYVILK